MFLINSLLFYSCSEGRILGRRLWFFIFFIQTALLKYAASVSIRSACFTAISFSFSWLPSCGLRYTVGTYANDRLKGFAPCSTAHRNRKAASTIPRLALLSRQHLAARIHLVAAMQVLQLQARQVLRRSLRDRSTLFASESTRIHLSTR